MPDPSRAHALLESYLSKVRSGLHGLAQEQVTEILQELRSDILDRAGANGVLTEESVRAALAALGDPEQIAGEYLTQNLFERATLTRSPLLMLQSLFHWATLSLYGFMVALFSLFMYMLGASFLMVAVLKPFHPDSIGLWALDVAGAHAHSYAIHLGGQDIPPLGREILGWWIVPIGLLLGLALIVITYRLDLRAIQEFRRHWRLPHIS
jgi:uncharacterized membrane protein